jgi:hypothetical protein
MWIVVWEVARVRLWAVVLAALLAIPASLPGVALAEGDVGVIRLSARIDFGASPPAPGSWLHVNLRDLASRSEGRDSPRPSRIVAGMDRDAATYSFELTLPEQPAGQPFALAGATSTGPGPQVFYLDVVSAFVRSRAIGPPDPPRDWHPITSSIRELDGIRGQLAVWSSGAGEVFPAGAGADGLALTSDDPVVELQPGWTVVDTNGQEYAFIRDSTTDVSSALLVTDPVPMATPVSTGTGPTGLVELSGRQASLHGAEQTRRLPFLAPGGPGGRSQTH